MLRLAILLLIGLSLLEPAAAQPVWRGLTSDFRHVGGEAVCGTVNAVGPRHPIAQPPEDPEQLYARDTRHGRIALAPVDSEIWEPELSASGPFYLTVNGRILLRLQDDALLWNAYSVGEFEIIHVQGGWPPTGFYFTWGAFFRIDARGNWCMTVPFANWPSTEDPFPSPRRRDRATAWMGVGEGASHYAHYDGRRMWFERRWVDPARPAPERTCHEFHEFALDILSSRNCRLNWPPPSATLAPWRANHYMLDLMPGLPIGATRPIHAYIQEPRIRGLTFARMLHARCNGAPPVNEATFRRQICGR